MIINALPPMVNSGSGLFIETGAYLGNNDVVYSKENPASLQFSGRPKMVYIYGQVDDSRGYAPGGETSVANGFAWAMLLPDEGSGYYQRYSGNGNYSYHAPYEVWTNGEDAKDGLVYWWLLNLLSGYSDQYKRMFLMQQSWATTVNSNYGGDGIFRYRYWALCEPF